MALAFGEEIKDAISGKHHVDPFCVVEEKLAEKTKAESDQLVMNAARKGTFTYSILRPSNVFGPTMTNQSLFQMIEMISKGLFFFIGKDVAINIL